jgi:hypothetical protein
MAMRDRRQFVEKQQALAEAARLAGRFEEADTIKSQLKEQFSRYTDLADLFPPTPGEPGNQQKKPESPSPGPRAQPDSSEPSHDASTVEPSDPQGSSRPLQAAEPSGSGSDHSAEPPDS